MTHEIMTRSAYMRRQRGGWLREEVWVDGAHTGWLDTHTFECGHQHFYVYSRAWHTVGADFYHGRADALAALGEATP